MANFNLGDIDLGSGADIDGFLSAPADEQGGIYSTSTIMQSVVSNRPYTEFQVGGDHGYQTEGASGIDAMFDTRPQVVQASLSLDALYTPQPSQPRGRKLVASCSDLKSFTRVSSETLVHKSNNDLWRLNKEADGKFYIERLFDDNGEPLKG